MSTDLGFAIIMYLIAVLYLHNNNKELLETWSNSIPVLALASYYMVTMLFHGP